MKKQNLRLLASVFSLILLASCSDNAGGETVQTDAPTTGNVTETEAVTDTYVRDSLPADLDFGGEVVTFYYRDEIANEFCAAEVDGELVNDALYNSHLAV